MTGTIIIPLNKLYLDPKNVRKTYSAEGIAALAASIRADGHGNRSSCPASRSASEISIPRNEY
ncbi:hypothetical protein [Mesorhizobium sp. M0895]|uniref:hypothetical protein n=1 Tax=Mesorhizobium sp. M0895 TaxID=2957019 RepID=UPI003337E76A